MTRREPLRGKALQAAIIDLARKLGWRCARFPTIQDVHGRWRTPVAADGKGWPDLVLVRDRVLVREVKGDGDSLRPEQSEWLAAFRLAGADAGVWKPRDWLDGIIEEELRRRGNDGAAIKNLAVAGPHHPAALWARPEERL